MIVVSPDRGELPRVGKMPIANVKQAKITRNEIDRFQLALADAKKRPAPEGTDPIMWKGYQDGMESQLETLMRELREFNARNGAGDGI